MSARIIVEYNNSMIVRYKYLTKSNDRISCITHTGESYSDVAPGVEGLVANVVPSSVVGLVATDVPSTVVGLVATVVPSSVVGLVATIVPS